MMMMSAWSGSNRISSTLPTAIPRKKTVDSGLSPDTAAWVEPHKYPVLAQDGPANIRRWSLPLTAKTKKQPRKKGAVISTHALALAAFVVDIGTRAVHAGYGKTVVQKDVGWPIR